MMLFKKWLKEISGATAIEYVLIVAGITISIIVMIFAFGEDLGSFFDTMANMAGSAAGKV